MQFPDTQQTRDTNSIMQEVSGRFPELTGGQYNRIFGVVYKQIGNGLTGDELASIVHASLIGDKDLKNFWVNATRFAIQHYYKEKPSNRHAFEKSIKGKHCDHCGESKKHKSHL